MSSPSWTVLSSTTSSLSSFKASLVTATSTLTSLVNVGHIKIFKLSRLIIDSSSEEAQISKLMIVNYFLIPSSEGACRAASKLIVGSTIVFELAVCPACIIFCNKPHKLIGKHFIASNYGVGFQLKFPRGGGAPSILCNTLHWLIVENILPGARVIPNISCEEPHGRAMPRLILNKI